MAEHDLQLRPKFDIAIELLEKRWTGLIICLLLSRPKRFKHISDLIPSISDRMLSKRLKDLEISGVFIRRVNPESPVRIKYELTEKGNGMEVAIRELHKWIEE